MPFNAVGQNAALTGGIGNTITHIGVHDLTDPGTATNFTGTEATGGAPAYARLAAAWGTAAAGQRSNSGVLTFDVPAGTYGFFTFHNALTGNTNNYLGYSPFGGATPVKGFGTVNAAGVTADAIYSQGQGMANTDRVMVYNEFAKTLPAGLTEGTIYFVVGAATDSFQVSLTSGGAAVDITGVGDLYYQRVIAETFGAQGQITVAVAALVLDATAV